MNVASDNISYTSGDIGLVILIGHVFMIYIIARSAGVRLFGSIRGYSCTRHVHDCHSRWVLKARRQKPLMLCRSMLVVVFMTAYPEACPPSSTSLDIYPYKDQSIPHLQPYLDLNLFAWTRPSRSDYDYLLDSTTADAVSMSLRCRRRQDPIDLR